MLPQNKPDRIRILFDDHWWPMPACSSSWARRIASDAFCRRLPDASAAHRQLGTFLRSFRWGHVRQLTGEPPVVGPGLGRWGRTRHSPLTSGSSARPMDWPRRERATTAIPAPAAITRCWPLPPAPARC